MWVQLNPIKSQSFQLHEQPAKLLVDYNLLVQQSSNLTLSSYEIFKFHM